MKDKYSKIVHWSIVGFQSRNTEQPEGILMNNKDVKKWKKQIQDRLIDIQYKEKLYFMGIRIYKTKDIEKGTIKVF